MSNDIILYNARLIDPSTQRDEVGGLRIINGCIADVGAHLRQPPASALVTIDMNGLCLAPALIDIDVTPHECESAAQFTARAHKGGVVLWQHAHASDYVPSALEMQRRLQQQPLVATRPHDMVYQGFAHDTAANYRYGLPILPVFSETLPLQRDMTLANTLQQGRYHALGVSSAAAVALLQQHASPYVSASVSLHHLLLNYIDTLPFRTDTLLSPPLRDETDRLALCHAVIDGHIAIVTAQHRPCYATGKLCPPQDATRGAADIEHLLPALLTLHHVFNAPLWQALAPATCHAARVFGLNGGTLALGAPAHLMAFDPCASQRIDAQTSPRTALHGRVLEGMVRYTWQHGTLVYKA